MTDDDLATRGARQHTSADVAPELYFERRDDA